MFTNDIKHQHNNNSYAYLFLISAALQALKRKRRYEKQLQDVDANLSTVEFQREALENACSNTEVLRAMSSASNAVQGQSHRTRV